MSDCEWTLSRTDLLPSGSRKTWRRHCEVRPRQARRMEMATDFPSPDVQRQV